MNANFAYLGWLLLIFALFNSVFLGGFFRTAYQLGKPFLLYTAAAMVLIGIAEALHHVPGWEGLNSQTEGFGLQLIVLAAGAVIYAAATVGSCRRAEGRFEKLDL